MATNDPILSDNTPQADAGFAGTLKNIQLNDLIQMCCLSASSLCMRVNKEDRLGTIFIVDGEIVHAACEDLVGEEAFYRILCWQTGSFESLEVSTLPERTIHKNYHFLIMEAARRVDDMIHANGQHAEEITLAELEELDDRLRVLIVDDSPMMRKILSSILTTSGRIKVVGMANNGKEAVAMIDELSPDLVTLDVNMPVMDGTSTIKHIMIKKPCPVVITSNPGDGMSKQIFNFLELGAVDFMSKPTKNQDILLQQQKILERVRIAATAKVKNFRICRSTKPKHTHLHNQLVGGNCERLVIVVTGPGGHPEQIQLLADLGPAMEEINGAVLAIQSLPSAFGHPFARYIIERCGCPASFIQERMELEAGHCHVGIHGCALTVGMDNGKIVVEPGEAGSLLPIDHLLSTAAATFTQWLTVVLLSGANTGKQEGLRAVQANGGRIIVRERSSCMVADPLDLLVYGDMVNAEVPPNKLVEAISNGFELQD